MLSVRAAPGRRVDPGGGVLRVAKVRAGGHAYYLEVAAGTGTGVEPAGRWLGSGSAALGLRGEVDTEALGAVLAGRHPGSGARLGPFHHRVTVAGYDLSFCAPKSVSLLHALGAPEVAAEVQVAHDRAVEEALDYVGRRAVAVRRAEGGVALPVPADAVAAAAFVHRSSRALDPHLHTHVVLANLGRDGDGRFSAVDGRGLWAHAPAAGALYHVQLRHELSARLGVAWEPLRGGRADVAGIGPEARAAFSLRAAAIAEHLAARGLAGPGARRIAGHATRPDKDVTRSAAELRVEWERRARSAGLGPGRLEAVLDRVPRRAAAGPDLGPGAGDAVLLDLAGRSSTLTRRDAVRAWCARLPTGAPAGAVERAVDRTLGAVPLAAGHDGRIERPGVGERRHSLDALGLSPGVGLGVDRGERRHLQAILARRSVSLPAGRGPERARGPEPDFGPGLG